MSRHRGVAAILVVILPGALAAGCAAGARGGPPPAAAPSPTVTTTHGVIGDAKPSPFRVVYDGHELELGPYTYCYENECADGFDPDPPSIGSPAEIHVQVTARDLDEFTARSTDDLQPDGTAKEDADWTSLPAEPEGDGWWVVRPAGPGGDSLVGLSARGDDAGDMFADLRWEIPADAG